MGRVHEPLGRAPGTSGTAHDCRSLQTESANDSREFPNADDDLGMSRPVS